MGVKVMYTHTEACQYKAQLIQAVAKQGGGISKTVFFGESSFSTHFLVILNLNILQIIIYD